MVKRYQEKGLRLLFRGDAAFPKPEMYEYLEQEKIGYTIRLPANQVLQRVIAHLLVRPAEWSSRTPIDGKRRATHTGRSRKFVWGHTTTLGRSDAGRKAEVDQPDCGASLRGHGE